MRRPARPRPAAVTRMLGAAPFRGPAQAQSARRLPPGAAASRVPRFLAARPSPLTRRRRRRCIRAWAPLGEYGGAAPGRVGQELGERRQERVVSAGPVREEGRGAAACGEEAGVLGPRRPGEAAGRRAGRASGPRPCCWAWGRAVIGRRPRAALPRGSAGAAAFRRRLEPRPAPLSRRPERPLPAPGPGVSGLGLVCSRPSR